MKLASYNSWLKWTLLTALALSSEFGAGQTTVLLRAASVSRETIRLSDLLPPKTSTKMQQAAEQIALGEAPHCHTIRSFEPSDIERRISSWPALHGLLVPSSVSVQRACFPIRREAVQRVIAEFAKQKELALTESPIQWPEVILALQENPALVVEQALPDPVRPALQFRVRCVERTVCPSFLVSVRTMPRSHSVPTLASHLLSIAAIAHNTEKSAALVESGQRVMLIFDDPPMRMQLPVTCLQRGALGEQVRAMDPSTHRVFRAQVTGAGSLTAHL